VFDLPAVADAAAVTIAAAGITERCEVQGMRRPVPRGGDAYLLKWVRMDRSDEQAVEVLHNCAKAMKDGGRVLAVEMTMPSDNRPSFAMAMDLQMMLLFDGGRIRTEEQLRSIFGAAGLLLVKAISLQLTQFGFYYCVARMDHGVLVDLGRTAFQCSDQRTQPCRCPCPFFRGDTSVGGLMFLLRTPFARLPGMRLPRFRADRDRRE
jgi:hypothetical protein